MGQGAVLDSLSEQTWITTCEIQASIEYISKQSITESLRRLYKKGLIEIKKDPNRPHGYLYRTKE